MPKHQRTKEVSEAANLERIRNYHQRMQVAFERFERVWQDCNQAAISPAKEDYQEWLDEIEMCAEALGTTFTLLRMLREIPHLNQK